MDKHADLLSWRLTGAIRYPAVFAGDEAPLLDVIAEAMRTYSRQDVLRLVVEPAVARARGDAEGGPRSAIARGCDERARWTSPTRPGPARLNGHANRRTTSRGYRRSHRKHLDVAVRRLRRRAQLRV